jgi:predicted porin
MKPCLRMLERRLRAPMTVVCIVLGLTTGSAGADQLAVPIISFSGFGTAGMAHSTERQADYTNSPLTKPNGAGYSHNWSPDVDSRLGLQLTANVTAQLSAVLQVISQHRYDNTYTPLVEWANLKYAFTPDFSVRVGRIAMPTFLVGDYRNVGYALPWVRPPVELYGQMVPITNSDGIDASYRMRFGQVTNTLQLSYGKDVIHSPDSAQSSTVDDLFGIFNTVSYGPATLRVSYQKAKVTLGSINPFFNLFRQFGPAGVIIADKHVAVDKPISFLTAGASYEPGNWFLMGEWGRSQTSMFIGTQSAWYVSGGYRFGTLTPYATYSSSKKINNSTDAGLDLALLPPFFQGNATRLNAGLSTLLNPMTGTTLSVGTRWDFKSNMALKLQLDRINLDPNSSGALINLQPGFRPGGKFHVISATVDFVF